MSASQEMVHGGTRVDNERIVLRAELGHQCM